MLGVAQPFWALSLTNRDHCLHSVNEIKQYWWNCLAQLSHITLCWSFSRIVFHRPLMSSVPVSLTVSIVRLGSPTGISNWTCLNRIYDLYSQTMTLQLPWPCPSVKVPSVPCSLLSSPFPLLNFHSGSEPHSSHLKHRTCQVKPCLFQASLPADCRWVSLQTESPHQALNKGPQALSRPVAGFCDGGGASSTGHPEDSPRSPRASHSMQGTEQLHYIMNEGELSE